MDLNARVDVNFEFSNGHCELILLHIFFHFDINQHQGPINTPNRISAKYAEQYWRNVLKCVCRRNFLVST